MILHMELSSLNVFFIICTFLISAEVFQSICSIASDITKKGPKVTHIVSYTFKFDIL